MTYGISPSRFHSPLYLSLSLSLSLSLPISLSLFLFLSLYLSVTFYTYIYIYIHIPQKGKRGLWWYRQKEHGTDHGTVASEAAENVEASGMAIVTYYPFSAVTSYVRSTDGNNVRALGNPEDANA